MTVLDERLTQTQANLLKPIKADHARYLFLTFADQTEFGGWIETVKPLVKSLEWQVGQTMPLGTAVLNLAITRAGLELLRPGEYRSDEEIRAQWDPPHELVPTDAFGSPMRDRLPLFGENDSSWSADWPTAWTTDLHALAWVSGTEAQADAMVADIRAVLPPGSELRLRRANHLAAGVDHFGFRDGISQPRIKGIHDVSTAYGGGAVRRPNDDSPSPWRLIEPGEFVVGLEDEGGETREPEPINVLRYAMFMALREIRMDTDLLSTFSDDWKEAFVGRKIGAVGEALSLPNGPTNPNDPHYNDFLYGDDQEGFNCPLGAHIRRSNPRDSLGFTGNLANRHRILRRGMPYTDGDDVGLVFIALQARIEDQFEFIQGHWLNSGGTLQVGQDPDIIAGFRAADIAETTFVKQGRPPKIAVTPNSLTTVQGGEYFVLPTLDGLQHLIDGT